MKKGDRVRAGIYYIESTPCMYYLGYVLIPPTLDSLIWHDFQHLFHFWQIEYWVTEDSCKVEYLDLADLHHGIEPNLKEKICFFKYTANVCRELQGLCREIGVQGFQIYGDCMYTRNPCTSK